MHPLEYKKGIKMIGKTCAIFQKNVNMKNDE